MSYIWKNHSGYYVVYGDRGAFVGSSKIKVKSELIQKVYDNRKKKNGSAKRRRSSNSYGNIFGGRSSGGLFY